MELAENGIIIDGYLLAILMSKSLPPSYDSFVSTIFAGINDLEQADPNYVASKIFEEEMRRESKSEDAHIAVQRNCLNCKCHKPRGTLDEWCFEASAGRQILSKVVKTKGSEEVAKTMGSDRRQRLRILMERINSKQT
ncbi:hypothetical protein K3495_g16879 [Podosphaera aphanis]|nr:hypothetical protein K3495_g16879 [Podosphaera aphanis]